MCKRGSPPKSQRGTSSPAGATGGGQGEGRNSEPAGSHGELSAKTLGLNGEEGPLCGNLDLNFHLRRKPRCGSGLGDGVAEDIGRRWGCHLAMSSLCRTRVQLAASFDLGWSSPQPVCGAGLGS